MENNNGKGIFYGVIGIATLIVAIIGATFAYFTATVQSEDGAINVTSYSGFSVSLVMNKIAPGEQINKLIPLNSGLYMDSALSHTDSAGAAQPCIDVNGDQVCAIYEMTLTNGGTDVEIQGFLSAEVNEYNGYNPSNLKYRLYSHDGSAYTALSNTVTAPFAPDASLSDVQKAEYINSLPKFVYGPSADNTTLSLTEGESRTLYLVMWLEDTGSEQNSDIGKRFTGKVTFNAISGGSGEEQLVARFS